MEWLSQNWIWLALGVGVILMMRHGGAGGCCGGGGHGADHKRPDAEASQSKNAGGGAGHQH